MDVWHEYCGNLTMRTENTVEELTSELDDFAMTLSSDVKPDFPQVHEMNMSSLHDMACNFHETHFYGTPSLALIPEDCADMCHKNKACHASQFEPKHWSALSTIPIRLDVALGELDANTSRLAIGREARSAVARLFGARACRGESCITIRDVGKKGDIEMWIRAPLAHARRLAEILVENVRGPDSKLRIALPQLTGHIQVLQKSKFRTSATAAKCADTVAATCWGAALHNAEDDPYECEGFACKRRECCIEGMGECLMGASMPLNASSNPMFSCFLKVEDDPEGLAKTMDRLPAAIPGNSNKTR